VDNIPLSVSDFAVPDNTSLVHNGEQRVAPLDMLEIKVFGSTGLDGNYQVDPSGQIKLPLIGAVPAKGYTTFDLAAALETKFGQFLQSPQVTVRISEMNGQQFMVDGASASRHVSGRGPMTLLQAVALSGGARDNANLSGISGIPDDRRKAAGCSV